MARDGTGVYAQVGGDFVTGQVIDASTFNSKLTDMANALTQSLSRDGQGAMTGALPMGNSRITGLGAGTARTDAVQVAQMQDGGPVWLGTLGGTATAITGTLSPTITAYVTGMTIRAKVGTTCGAAPTLNLNAVGAKKIYAATTGGVIQAQARDLIAGQVTSFTYDATLDAAAGGWIADLFAENYRLRGSVAAASSLSLTFPAGISLFRLNIWTFSTSVNASLALRCLTAGVPDAGASDYTYVTTGGESTTPLQSTTTTSFVDLATSVNALNNANRLVIDQIDPGSAFHPFQVASKYTGIASTGFDRNMLVGGRRVAAGVKSGIQLFPVGGTFQFEYLFEGIA